MEVEEIIGELVKKYGKSMKVHYKHFSDFNGEIVKIDGLPRRVKREIEVLKENNEEKQSPVVDNVSAVLIVKKSAKIVAKFYGENRLATPREIIGMLRWYPENVRTVHAEYDAVLNFIDWYSWKEPTKNRKYSFDLVVVRNGGNVPARPCKYCRSMLRELIGKLTVYYPIDGEYYGVEVIGE